MQYVSINNIPLQLITLRKDNAAQETLVTQYYAQIVGLSEGHVTAFEVNINIPTN